MKVLLTGITGNLGHEVALDLQKRGFEITPIVRPGKRNELSRNKIQYNEIIESDLTSEEEFRYLGSADCLIHSAGNIHFRDTGGENERMTAKLITYVKKVQIPIYFISTAYIYRPSGIPPVFNNAYELDKFRSEQLLISSGIPYTIFRPSVLMGNSISGEIQNMSGYSSIVKVLVTELNASKRKGKTLRFPKISGKSNLVPVDQAAFYIGIEIQNPKNKLIYITNPHPPEAAWVLKETVDFFNLSKVLELVELSFEQYGKLKLTAEEQTVYNFMKHYYPYWSITYDFPKSICEENLINHEYLVRTLRFLTSQIGEI